MYSIHKGLTTCSFIASVETVLAIIVVNTFRENLQSLRMSDAADVQDLKGGHAPAQKVRQIYFILFKVFEQHENRILIFFE